MPSLFLYADNRSVCRYVYTFDGSVKLGYTYQYDAMDRITEVRRSSSPNSQYLAYEYDALGQLVGPTDHAAGLEYTYSLVWDITMLLKSIGLYEDVKNYIIEAQN